MDGFVRSIRDTTLKMEHEFPTVEKLAADAKSILGEVTFSNPLVQLLIAVGLAGIGYKFPKYRMLTIGLLTAWGAYCMRGVVDRYFSKVIGALVDVVEEFSAGKTPLAD